MSWRIVVASRAPDEYGRFDPAAVLLMMASTYSLSSLLSQMGEQLKGYPEARFVGIYAQ